MATYIIKSKINDGKNIISGIDRLDDDRLIEFIKTNLGSGRTDSRTKFKYIGTVNINGEKQGKWLAGIPNGSALYAYVKEVPTGIKYAGASMAPYGSITDNAVAMDFNDKTLAMLESIGKKGDAWYMKWGKLLDMTQNWSQHQWLTYKNDYPRKYELIMKNKEYAENEAAAINAEWNHALDALSHVKLNGAPSEFHADFRRYQSTDNTIGSRASSEFVQAIKEEIAEMKAKYQPKRAAEFVADGLMDAEIECLKNGMKFKQYGKICEIVRISPGSQPNSLCINYKQLS